MSLSKSEMTTKSLENSNIEEQLSDSGLFKNNGTKPKPFPTHHSAAELSNLIPDRSYQDQFVQAHQAYFLPQWNHNAGFQPSRHRTLSVSSTSLSIREHNASLTKFQTKICDHWRRSGSCSYGDACWYAHGEDDLRKLLQNGPRSARIDEKTSKDEKSLLRRPPTPGPISNLESNLLPTPIDDSDFSDAIKIAKAVEESKERVQPPPAKRASTNVKGLTVTIPPNIAFKEQVSNASLPLSPAQERWVSMSCGAPTSEKGGELMNEFEAEFEKKQTLDSAFDRRLPGGQFDMTVKQDDFGFLSPNPFPFNARMPPQNGHVHHQHRSFSRGPHQRITHGAPPFAGIPPQHPAAGQHQARVSRSGTSGFGFDDPRQFMPRSSSLIRSTRDNPQMNHNGSQPQIQQACWNLAGDIYQRQKDMESSGLRGAFEQQQQQMSSRKIEELELNRLLAAQHHQQKKQEMMLEYESSKLKDLAFLHLQLERGAIQKHQVPRELWKDLMNNLPLLNQNPMQQFAAQNGFKGQGANRDCACGGSAPKQPSEHVSLHSHFARQQAFHQQQQQLRRFGIPTPELSAPPKMFESLLPSDDSFSIWLDPKPKKETSSFIREPVRQASVDIGDGLLDKMDILRSGRCPISNEEMRMSHGPPKSKRSDRATSSEDSSPIGMSLMELLSSENFLSSAGNQTKTTMFDFDSLQIAETLRMTPQSSRHTSSSGKSQSPIFFVGEEKANGYEDVCSGLFTPLSASNPAFLERCDFFAASGSCPFGDGCNLSHAIPDQQKQELRAL